MREYLEQFKVHLASEEKSKATIEKYVRASLSPYTMAL